MNTGNNKLLKIIFSLLDYPILVFFNATVYVLGPDLAARGMSEDRVIDGIQVVDYSGFVDLTTKHDTCQSWL